MALKILLNYSLLFLLLLTSFSCTKNPVEPENQQNNKIVFDRDNNVFLSDINIGSGGEERQIKLTNTDPGWSARPVWSPDGQKIAFTSYRNGTVGIYIINTDGTNEIKLTSIYQPDQIGHVWSPDGMNIAFQTEDGIYIVSSNGTNERRLTNKMGDRNPSWSPNGSKIAFCSYGETDSLGSQLEGIYVIDSDGSNLKRITDNSINARSPLWLPDGNNIAFMRADETFFGEIYIMKLDGSGLRQLTPSNLDVTYMATSPDGTRIAFCHYITLYKLDLYIINIDGSGLKKLNPEGINLDGLGHISWSSDGNMLIFGPGYSLSEQRTTENYGIYTINSDGSNLQYFGKGNNPQLSPKPLSY
jgi:TolB protein